MHELIELCESYKNHKGNLEVLLGGINYAELRREATEYKGIAYIDLEMGLKYISLDSGYRAYLKIVGVLRDDDIIVLKRNGSLLYMSGEVE